MKAFEITEAGKEALLSRKFQMVRVNYANPDMVRCRRCSGPQWPPAPHDYARRKAAREPAVGCVRTARLRHLSLTVDRRLDLALRG